MASRSFVLTGATTPARLKRPPAIIISINAVAVWWRMLDLPFELTPFIGRDTELDDLARLLTDAKCGLITVVGPGGSGKTRLARWVRQINPARINAALNHA